MAIIHLIYKKQFKTFNIHQQQRDLFQQKSEMPVSPCVEYLVGEMGGDCEKR